MLDRDDRSRQGAAADDRNHWTAQERVALLCEEASVADDESEAEHGFAGIEEHLLQTIFGLSVFRFGVWARGIGTQEELALHAAFLCAGKRCVREFDVAATREVVRGVDDDFSAIWVGGRATAGS